VQATGPVSALRSRRELWLLLGVLVLLSLARVWKLELDPPYRVIRGYHDQAHFRDEVAKAHEARNKAVWGTWSLADADEYGFWRAQSPAWVWGEYLWFRALGVGLLQARAFVVVHSIVALALLMWLAWVRHGWPAGVAVGLLLGCNWGYLVYSRLALMEGALLCWLLVATVGLAQMHRQPAHAGAWGLFASASMLIACTIKQTGLLLVPAFSLMLLWLGAKAAEQVGQISDAGSPLRVRVRARLRRREAQLALVAVAGLGLVLLALVLSPEYQERLAFNAVHFTAAREESSVLGRAAVTLLRGFFSFRLQLMFFALAPIIMWLATLELVRVCLLGLRAWQAKRRGQVPPLARGVLERAPDVLDWWMLAWAVCALLANLASPHRAVRFQLVMLPPAAWLAAALLARAWLHTWPRAWIGQAVRVGSIVLALLGLTVTAQRFAEWMRESEATAAWVGDDIEALIGERDAVVVGEFAAQAVFETPYKHFYVRPTQFNDSPEIMAQLGITHLAVYGEEDFVEDHMQRKVPDWLIGRRRLGTVRYRAYTLTIWELASPERRAELKAWEQRRAEAEAAKQRRAEQAAAKRKRLENAAAQCLPDPLPEPKREPFTAQAVGQAVGQPVGQASGRARPGIMQPVP
jgi:hypothetical protein